MHHVVRAVLQSCFGLLSEDLLAALGQADEQTLAALSPHIATGSLEAVRALLGLSE
jgi:hypothetical protein